ncbi:MAG: hypothetical protein L6461_21280, partial [Anaerolineae bacterium]|nr:hypothetical protein [Anaerolineae bacterium]
MAQTAFLDTRSEGISLGIQIGSAQLLVELGSGAWLCASLFVGCRAGVRLPHIHFNHVFTNAGTITQPAVLATETALELAPEQRKRTVWRLDGGSGSDEQLTWLLSRGYHISAKGMSSRRAEALS